MREPVEDLIRQHQKHLFAAAFSICQNTSDADDVVQDTFLKYHISKIFNMMSDSLTANMDDAEKVGKLTVVNNSDEGTGKTETVCVYEESDYASLTEDEELPSWLEKAEKDLKITE